MSYKQLVRLAKRVVPRGVVEEVRSQMVGPEKLFRVCSPSFPPHLAEILAYQKGSGHLNGRGYYEFGIFRGYSIWFAQNLAQRWKQEDLVFYGFDSFEGLPTPQGVDAGGEFMKGDFSAGYEEVRENLESHGADFSTLKLFQGFFSDQLFKRFEEKEDFRKASIVVVDCDLYSSTVPVLSFIDQYLEDGTIVVFDDYNCFDKDDNRGQRRALKEFEARAPQFAFEPFGEYGWHGQSFIVRTAAPPR